MTDVRTQPLIAQQGNIRVEPFVQPAVDPSLASLPPSVARSAGVKAGGSSQSPALNPDTNGDGKLSDEEVGHLQDAAAKGDKESWDLLNALKLPLGIAAGAAALYGATRGGLGLVDAYAKAKGLSMFGDQQRSPNGAKMPVKEEPQKLLPAPTKQITDQTGNRFQQAAPKEPIAIPDQRTVYEKTGGKLPTGKAAAEALREAARAMRRMH